MIELRARPSRPARKAQLTIRFGRVTLKRPEHLAEQGDAMAETIEISLVEVSETGAPADVEPVFFVGWFLRDV